METFSIRIPGSQTIFRRSHVGVVGSGDAEILLEPGNSGATIFNVRTASDGFQETWKVVFTRFTAGSPVDAVFTINDFGATPGIIGLRLAQALELANQKNTEL